MKYVLQESKKTLCKYCRNSVSLLIEYAPYEPGYPIFYICFDCKKVFQAGEGEVEKV